MTDLARRPRAPRPGARSTGRRAPSPPKPPGLGTTDHHAVGLPLAALLAAGWAVALGLLLVVVVVLVAWSVSVHSDSTASQAFSAAGTVWVLLHGTPLTVGASSVGVMPLGFVVVPLWLTHRAGRWAGRASGAADLGDAALLVAAASLVYAIVAAIVAGASATPGVAVVPLSALGYALAVAMLGFGTGVVRTCGLGAALVARVPASAVHVARAGLAAAVTLAGLAALLVAASLALHLHDGVGMLRALQPGLVGMGLLTLLGAAYLPVLVVWAGAFLAGPGFAVGEGTAFSPIHVTPGTMPAVPVLAALPPSVPGWAPLLMVLPLLAGAVGGAVLLRRLPEHTTTVLLGEVAGVAVVCGALWAMASAVAAGGIGPGRLGVAGAVWWQVGLAVAAETFAGVLAVVLADTLRMRFQSGPDSA